MLWIHRYDLTVTVLIPLFKANPGKTSGCLAGCIAGIVIACLVILGGAAGGGYYVYNKK